MSGAGRSFVSAFFSAECLAEQEPRSTSAAAAVPDHHAGPGFHVEICADARGTQFPHGLRRSSMHPSHQGEHELFQWLILLRFYGTVNFQCLDNNPKSIFNFVNGGLKFSSGFSFEKLLTTRLFEEELKVNDCLL